MTLISKAKKENNLNREELVKILSFTDYDAELFYAANEARREFVGDEIHLRGLIEFSNTCARACKYCGLRVQNKKLERYELEPETIVEFARKAVDCGYKTIVLQSGEGVYTFEKLIQAVRKIKEFNVDITLSTGEKTYEEYAALKKAGADRYLLRIETTDEKLYEKMHPGMNFQNRVRCLHNIKELGYELGCGCLVGLPEQTIESLANDILFFKEIGADMVGIGPFIPNPDTPLKDATNDNFTLALKVMALTRLMLPDINIPATTAMEVLNPQGRIIALQSGANVIMPNVTESDYQKKYEIYPGKISISENLSEYRSQICKKIAAIGRSVSDTPGKSKRFTPK